MNKYIAKHNQNKQNSQQVTKQPKLSINIKLITRHNQEHTKHKSFQAGNVNYYRVVISAAGP